MTSLGLVLAFISELDGERHDGTASVAVSAARHAEFPACMASDSNLGRALALTRELLAESGDAGATVPAPAVATLAVQAGRPSAAHARSLAAAV